MRTSFLLPILLGLAAGCRADGAATSDAGCPTDTYRIDQVLVPRTYPEVRDATLQLDDAVGARNAAGAVMVALQMAQAEIVPGLQARLDARFGGDVDWRFEVVRCDSDVRVRGLGGDATVEADGSIAGGHLIASHGSDVFPAGALVDFADTGATGWVPTELTAIDLQLASGDGIVGGVMTGYQHVIAVAVVPWVQALAASGTSPWAVSVDRNRDGAITTAELEADSFYQALVRPDIDTDHDGTADGLSFGFAIHATKVP